ncbi:MAG TPA: cupin domain-containing protein [Pseudomonadota bacterium]|nr:cupin domain-containing protein [Pseudomonadota bacterium]
MPDTPRYLVRAAELQAQPEFVFHHPLNPRSAIAFRQQDGKTLSELTGLTRLGVHLCRILPGKEGFAYHRHHREEEWVFVLSGRGIAEIGDEEFEIGPGDFLGYPAGGAAHHLKNPHAEDLVCLMGGERCSVEVADFPRDGKRLLRDGQKEQLVNVADLQPLFPAGDEGTDPQVR